MADYPNSRRLERSGRAALPLALGALLLLAADVHAGADYQHVAVGNGLPRSECVRPGADGILQSTPAGDDSVFGTTILSGPNGICETPLAGDDVRPPNGVILGRGLPNGGIILADRFDL